MAILEKCGSAFIETAVDDEVVIVGLDRGEFFSLTGTGLAIWRLIDGKRDREAIIDGLESEFDAPRDQLANDLDAFLADLRDVGFVKTG